eukprot:453559_1
MGVLLSKHMDVNERVTKNYKPRNDQLSLPTYYTDGMNVKLFTFFNYSIEFKTLHIPKDIISLCNQYMFINNPTQDEIRCDVLNQTTIIQSMMTRVQHIMLITSPKQITKIVSIGNLLVNDLKLSVIQKNFQKTIEKISMDAKLVILHILGDILIKNMLYDEYYHHLAIICNRTVNITKYGYINTFGGDIHIKCKDLNVCLHSVITTIQTGDIFIEVERNAKFNGSDKNVKNALINCKRLKVIANNIIIGNETQINAFSVELIAKNQLLIGDDLRVETKRNVTMKAKQINEGYNCFYIAENITRNCQQHIQQCFSEDL